LSEASTTNQRKPGQTFIVNLHVISSFRPDRRSYNFFHKNVENCFSLKTILYGFALWTYQDVSINFVSSS
jgi:hypothetical protein